MAEIPNPVTPTVFVLCDYAEVLNGKLYMMGAGIDRVSADLPVSLAIGLLWHVPWDRTNHPHLLSIVAEGEDGEPYLDADGNPVRIEGQFEVGRPPGMKHGDPIGTPLGIRLPPLVFAEGGYRWRLSINDGEVTAVAKFRSTRIQ